MIRLRSKVNRERWVTRVVFDGTDEPDWGPMASAYDYDKNPDSATSNRAYAELRAKQWNCELVVGEPQDTLFRITEIARSVTSRISTDRFDFILTPSPTSNIVTMSIGEARTTLYLVAHELDALIAAATEARRLLNGG